MSSLITTILQWTVGLLCDKARDSAANKLKNGDLADEKLREIIVRDLRDVMSKLDCLSLKDLDASYSFLKEGVELLNLALGKLSKDQKASEISSDEETRVVNNTASGILNAASSLPQAIKTLKISCDERFVSAKDRFKSSRERATIAFNNKSLSIKDRIMACKLRVAATILESGLEDPEAATTACLLPLKELHGLPTIQEMFAVFLKGGLKSMFKKAERLEIVMSVSFINHALYDFASKYRSKSTNIFTWPQIELKYRVFHPIINAHQIFMKKSSDEDLVQQVNQVFVNSRIAFYDFAVNSRGDIIVVADTEINIIYRTGETKDVKFLETTGRNVITDVFFQEEKSFTVDINDNLYVVKSHKTRDGKGVVNFDLLLYVFDENYDVKLVSVLEFLDGGKGYVDIAVDKNQNLIIVTSWNDQVYVSDNTGKLKFQFKRDGRYMRSLNISDNNDIMIASDNGSAVKIFSGEGNLKSVIKVPKGHIVIKAVFHHGIGKIIILTCVLKKDSWFLLSCSETGELGNPVFLSKRCLRWGADIKCHASGPVAVAVAKSITFI